MMYSFSTLAATDTSKLIRFEFSNYEGEGSFNLYRLDINLKSKVGQFCFLDSVNANLPNELAGIVYREEAWSGHFDFDKENNKACFDIQLADAVDWFASPKPIKYGAYEYQYFFLGKITPIPLANETQYSLNGDLNILMQSVAINSGRPHIFTNSIKLSCRNVPN